MKTRKAKKSDKVAKQRHFSSRYVPGEGGGVCGVAVLRRGCIAFCLYSLFPLWSCPREVSQAEPGRAVIRCATTQWEQWAARARGGCPFFMMPPRNENTRWVFLCTRPQFSVMGWDFVSLAAIVPGVKKPDETIPSASFPGTRIFVHISAASTPLCVEPRVVV